MTTTKPITTIAAEVLDLANGATPEPWRYGALEHGGRCVTDGRGYLFAQVDDDGNGRLIASYRSATPELAAFVQKAADVLVHAPVQDSGPFEAGWNGAIDYVSKLLGLPEVP